MNVILNTWLGKSRIQFQKFPYIVIGFNAVAYLSMVIYALNPSLKLDFMSIVRQRGNASFVAIEER